MRRRSLRDRCGFTLAEVLVSVSLGGVVAGAALGLLLSGIGAARAQIAAVELAAQTRAARYALVSELGDGSAALVYVGATMIRYNAVRSSGLICGVSPPVYRVTGGRAPDPEIDSLEVGMPVGGDVWSGGRFAGAVAAACADGTRGWELQGLNAAAMVVGAPALMLETAEFSVYRGGDGRRWLGFRRRRSDGTWVHREPVAGPVTGHAFDRVAGELRVELSMGYGPIRALELGFRKMELAGGS